MRKLARSISRASARRQGRDPYFRHFYKIGMDGKGLTLLTPENADHDIGLSPSGKYFVDNYSRARRADGVRRSRHDRPGHSGARESRRLASRRDRMEAAGARSR